MELWELGVLQGFPPDFPWHLAGTKTAQARVIGNAVPPPVAAAVVGALTGRVTRGTLDPMRQMPRRATP